MANTASNNSVAEEAALSAIEAELTDANTAKVTEPSVEKKANEAKSGKDGASDQAFDFGDSDQIKTPSSSAISNDKSEEIDKFVTGVNASSSSRSFVIAGIFSLIWGGLVLGTGFAYFGEALQTSSEVGGISSLVLLGFTLILAFLPVFLSFVTAALFSRTKKMEMTTRSMTHLAMRFAEPDGLARDNLAALGQAVRREVSIINDGIDKAVARASELESRVQHEIAVIESSFGDSESKMRLLINELREQGDSIMSGAEAIRTSLSSIHGETTGELERLEESIGDKAKDVVDVIESKLTDTRESFLNSLDSTMASVDSILAEREISLKTQLESGRNNIVRALETAGEDVIESFNGKGAEVRGQLTQSMTSLANVLNDTKDSLVQSLSDQSRTVTGSLESTSKSIATSINESTSVLMDSLKATGDSIVVTMTLRGSDMAERLAESGDKLNAVIETKSSEAISKINNLTTNLSDKLTGDAEILEGKFNVVLETIGGQFENSASLFTETVTESFKNSENLWLSSLGEITTNFSSAQTEFLSQLEGHRTQITTTLKDNGEIYLEDLTGLSQGLKQEMSATSDAMRQTLDFELDRLQEMLEVTGTKIDDSSKSIIGNIGLFGTSFDESVTNLSESFDKNSTSISEMLTMGNQLLNRDLTQGAEKLATTISESSQQISDTVEKNLADVSNTLQTKTDGITDKLAELIETTDDKLSELVETTDSELGTRAVEVTTVIGDRIGQFEELLDGRMVGIIEGLDEKTKLISDILSERAAEAGETLQEHSSDAAEALKLRAEDINAVLSIRSAEFANLLVAKGDELSATLMECGDNVIKSLSETGGALDAAIEQRTDNTLSKISASHEVVNSGISEVLTNVEAVVGRIHENSSSLKDVVTNANESLGLIEGQLHRRSEDLRVAVEASNSASRESSEALATQVGTMREIAGTLLGNVANLASRFDGHATSLVESAETLERANLRIEGRLGQQQDIMSTISDKLIGKIEDIDVLLRGSFGMVDEAVIKSESRVVELAEGIQATTSRTVSSVEQELTRLSEIAEGEGKRATDLVGGIYEKFNAELHKFNSLAMDQSEITLREVSTSYGRVHTEMEEILGATAKQITDVSDQVKDSTRKIQDELSETRQEIRRSIDVMPEEARASGESIKRIVSDQVAAITELVQSANKSDALFRDTSLQSRASSTVVKEAPSAVPAPANIENYERGENLESKSWISKVLDRADDRPENHYSGNIVRGGHAGYGGQPPQGPKHSASDILGSLSHDISNAVDQAAVEDLWNRYRRGERDLFSRRLYTLKGQAIFDEIQNRYRRDGDFKAAADRYILDFERLISDISRDDPTGNDLSTYLISNTGKVYTLLLHASNAKS